MLEKLKKLNIQKTIGYLLITPSVVSVLFFLSQVVSLRKLKIDFELINRESYEGDKYYEQYKNGSVFTGYTSRLIKDTGYDFGDSEIESNLTSYSSFFPVYLGLLAIAGAYLIKDNSKKD